ncbi:MAG: BrnT family toxin [Acidobacteriota bacterium]
MPTDDFEWDAEKARDNFAKHGIHFADGIEAFWDPHAITLVDALTEVEKRYTTLAMDSLGRVVVVVYTWRQDRIRIISARKATAAERNRYGEGHETRI